MSDDWRNDRTS